MKPQSHPYQEFSHHSKIKIHILGQLLQFRLGKIQAFAFYVLMGSMGKQFMQSNDISRNLEQIEI